MEVAFKKKEIPQAFMSFFLFLNESPSHKEIALAFNRVGKTKNNLYEYLIESLLRTCFLLFLFSSKILEKRESVDAICDVYRALKSQISFSRLIEAPE